MLLEFSDMRVQTVSLFCSRGEKEYLKKSCFTAKYLVFVEATN